VLVDRHSKTGEEWFGLLLREPVDLAGHLRRKWGWQAADLLKSPLSPLEPSIRDAFPGNLIAHPMVKLPLPCRPLHQG
jgi:hypothetical protein